MKRSNCFLGIAAIVGALVISAHVTGAGAQQEKPREIPVLEGPGNSGIPSARKISGRVVRDGHQFGTHVLLDGPQSLRLNTTIAPDGSFEFPDVMAGTYRLRVGPNLSAPAPVTVVVDADDVSGIEIPIPRTAIGAVPVKFQLAAPTGAPLPRLKLNFVPIPSATQPGATVSISSPVHEQSMDIGVYRLNRLNDIALPPGYSIRSIMVGSTDLMKAPFRVSRSGVPPVQITFGVASPPWVRVSGRVTGLDQAPTRATTIRINLPGFITPIRATVSNTGVFELPFLRPGRHRVELEPAADSFSRVILVGDTGATDVRIPMVLSSVKVSGRVVALPEPLPQARIMAWLRPEPIATGLQSFATVVNEDGTFLFGAVPAGRYQLMVACEDPRGFRGTSDQCPGLTKARVLVPVADKDIRRLVIGEDALTEK